MNNKVYLLSKKSLLNFFFINTKIMRYILEIIFSETIFVYILLILMNIISFKS